MTSEPSTIGLALGSHEVEISRRLLERPYLDHTLSDGARRTAHGARDTMSMASASVAASMMANPATGSVDVMNGPSDEVTPAASWFRTCTGDPAIPI